MKNYLPSKKFVYLIIGFVVLGIIFLIVFVLFPGKSNFSSSKKGTGLSVDRLSMAALVQKDTDGDGIADWEEVLWGTDKNNSSSFDSISDSAYIANKKKELNINETNPINENLTETEKFAREFFTSFVAMKASGEINADTINNFSTALGEKIVYPSLLDSYSEKNVKVASEENKLSRMEYYSNLKKIFETYKTKGLGDELVTINSNLSSKETTDAKNNKLLVISNAYQDFAKKIMTLPVPQSLTINHLIIANSANNTGISVTSMAKISADPIVGLSGLSQYQKYSDELIQSVTDLEIKLQE